MIPYQPSTFLTTLTIASTCAALHHHSVATTLLTIFKPFDSPFVPLAHCASSLLVAKSIPIYPNTFCTTLTIGSTCFAFAHRWVATTLSTLLKQFNSPFTPGSLCLLLLGGRINSHLPIYILHHTTCSLHRRCVLSPLSITITFISCF